RGGEKSQKRREAQGDPPSQDRGTMICLDTNVLVRYIMQDDVKQSPKATKLIDSLTVEAPGFVSLVSVVELWWVLSSSYGLSREQVAEALELLLMSKAIVV